LADKFRRMGVKVFHLPLRPEIAEASRKVIHPLGLFRKIALLPAFILQVFRVSKLAKHLNIDLVHTNTLKADVIAGLGAALSRKRLIWSVHDRISRDYMPYFAVLLLRNFVRWLPDHVITNSNSTLHTFLPRLPKYFDVIYPGIEKPPCDVIGRMPSLRGESSCVNENVWKIGIVGRISPTKGHHIFVEAARLITERYPNTCFRIIGAAFFNDVRYEEELRAKVVASGAQNIEFLGFRNDVYLEIEKLDIVVHASTTPEPFGQVIVEAMICRKPIIATNAGGVREIVRTGETGWLVPMGDAQAIADRVAWIMANPEEVKRMVNAGYDRAVKKFIIGSSALKFEQIYEDVLANGSKRPPSVPDPEFPVGSL
jgi:glycosyltransferase involved in cell wall biosynthesis